MSTTTTADTASNDAILEHLRRSRVVGHLFDADGHLVVVRGGAGDDDPPAGDPPAGDPPAGDPPAGDPPAGDPPADPPESAKGFPAGTPLSEMTADQQAAYWKDKAQKHEKASKTNHAELEKLRKANLSDTEKALEDATEKGKAAGRAEVATIVAAAKIEVALAGVVPDPAAIVEDLNLAKYLTEDGEVDVEKVAALKAKFAGITKPGTPGGSADGGPQGDPKPGQLTRDQLKDMTPKQIVEAKAAGRLNDVLGVGK